MPETDTIPVSASVASTGPGIRYIGNWVYAYSGIIGVTATGGNTDEFLNFTSGSGIIKARFYWAYSETAADSLETNILFNETRVWASEGAHSASQNPMQIYVDLIIPPFTKVITSAENKSGATGRDINCTMTGQGVRVIK